MYPNNQSPPQNQLPTPFTPPPQNDPFSFITNSPPPNGKSIGPTSMKGRIILVSVGLGLLIIIAMIVFSLLGNSGQARTEQYLEIAKSQTEIIRISSLAEQKAKSLESKSLAVTTKLTFTTAQSDMNAILTKNGVNQKNLTKQLSASANKKSDELLTEAEKNNRFDETYTELVQNEIDNYKKLLTSAYSGASPDEMKTLESAYNQASTIFLAEKTEN